MESKEIIQYAVIIVAAIIGAVAAIIAAIISKKGEAINDKLPSIGFVLMGGLFAVFFVGLIAAMIYDFSILPHETANILVTKFDGENTETLRISDFVRDQLILSAPNLSKPIIIGGDTLTEMTKGQSAAYQLGKEWSANIVIWGYYTVRNDFYLQVNVENLKNTLTPNIDQSLQVIVQTDPKLLDDFTLQKQIGKELSNAVYGIYCYTAGEWECAINQLNSAIEITNENVFTYTNPSVLYRYRGGSYYFAKNYELAISDFESVLDSNRTDPKAYYLLGLAHEMKGEILQMNDEPAQMNSETIQAYSNYSIAAENYNFPDAYVRLAVIAAGLMDFENAVEYYEKAIEADSRKAYNAGDVETEKTIIEAYLQDGIALDKAGEYETAIEEFSRIVNLDYSYYEVYYYRGVTYMNLGENDKAISDFDNYISNGTNPDLVDTAKKYRWKLGLPGFLQWLVD